MFCSLRSWDAYAMPGMGNLVDTHHDQGVMVITVDSPPVNALSQGVPDGIKDAIALAATNDSVKAAVILGGGKTFIAGADINELEAAARNPEQAPDIHLLLEVVENSAKPVVMAIHGTALGGGIELALPGHYRVAVPEAMLGMPEANSGIVPGAEGTQRLPRLVGIPAAIDLLVTGRMMKKPEAKELGLVDRVIEGDLLTGAVGFAREIAGFDAGAFEAGRALAKKLRPNQTAPAMALEALEGAATLPFEEGYLRERAISKKSLATPQAQALIRLFFAERAVAKVPGLSPAVEPYAVKKVGIIGAGTMGGGIAMACVNAGIPVLLKDATQEGLDRGLATIRKNYTRSVQRGRTPQAVMDQRVAMIRTQLDYAGFEDADLIIEAAFESMELKKKLFREIDGIAKKDCVLATNTSTLDIDEIAGATSRPEMVVGLHFFSPANVMRLVEIVRGKKIADRTLATAVTIAKTLKNPRSLPHRFFKPKYLPDGCAAHGPPALEVH